jgi:hypothetical protein
MTGHGAFYGLVGVAFLLCCAACLLTADTISGERREGTLGLLLLTRVRHFDVLLGKFASSGLACLLALVAFLPVLVLPLLTGGVTGGEAGRMAVALFNTLFLALSVGLWASSRGFERYRTVLAALLVLAGLLLGPSLLGRILPSMHAEMASPLTTILQATDLTYRAAGNRYWLSLALVQIIGWAFLSSAMVCLRNRVTDSEDCEGTGKLTNGNPPSVQRSIASAQPAGPSLPPSPKCRYCGRPNDIDAVFCHECGMELHSKELQIRRTSKLSSAPTALHWLLRRQRGLKLMVWVAAFIGFVHFALFGMVGRLFGFGFGPFLGASWGFALITTAITGALFAWVASRFFVEARRTGELELLLTTPLGADQIVSTQWKMLQRLVRLPLAVMLLPIVLQGLFTIVFWSSYARPRLLNVYYMLALVLNIGNTILWVFAVCWLGLWFGLRMLGQGRVVLSTVLLAQGFPYVLSLAWSLFCQPFLAWLLAPSNSWWSSPWLLSSLLPQCAIVLFYLWLIRIARWHLSHELTGVEPLNLRQILSRTAPRMAAAIQRARQWRSV